MVDPVKASVEKVLGQKGRNPFKHPGSQTPMSVRNNVLLIVFFVLLFANCGVFLLNGGKVETFSLIGGAVFTISMIATIVLLVLFFIYRNREIKAFVRDR